jgi:hypothetical protein
MGQHRAYLSDYFFSYKRRQAGRLLNTILFCLYINDGLLVALSKAGVGCFIGDNFVGALAHADDINCALSTVSFCATNYVCRL